MDRMLGEFVIVLRRHGVAVAPPEAADAARAVALVGYADRVRFRETLAATLAKSHADRLAFEQCFDAFFRAPVSSVGAAGGPPPRRDNRPAGQGQAGGNGGGSGGGAGEPVPGVPPSDLGEALIANDEATLSLRMARAARDSKLADMKVITQKGLFGRRLLQAMGLQDLEREIAELDQSPAAGAPHRAMLLRDRLARLRERVRATVEQSWRLRRPQDREAVLRETDIGLLRESAEVTEVVRRMARRLVNRHRRRERRAARGRIDVRATLRRNVAHDGLLIDPRWRQVRKDRPRVIAVCDVSRSVSRHARFLLLFLYSLQEVIPRLRTFVFTSTLHEVTDLFAAQPADAALETVMQRHGLGSSDYGRALAQLGEQVLANLDRRTTLLFLGDARNNRGDARLDLLRLFQARSRQLLWLNPEERNRWGSGDSEMPGYATACTRAWSCRNLAELERIIDRLLRDG